MYASPGLAPLWRPGMPPTGTVRIVEELPAAAAVLRATVAARRRERGVMYVSPATIAFAARCLAVAALAGVIGWQEHRVRAARADTAREHTLLVGEQRDRAAERDRASRAALEQSEKNREVEALRRRAQQGVVDAIRTENGALARHAASLAAVDARMHDRAGELAAACGGGAAAGDRPAAAGSPTAAAAGLVLADLYRGADREAVELARAYDAARSAGLGCERIHDALTP